MRKCIVSFRMQVNSATGLGLSGQAIEISIFVCFDKHTLARPACFSCNYPTTHVTAHVTAHILAMYGRLPCEFTHGVHWPPQQRSATRKLLHCYYLSVWFGDSLPMLPEFRSVNFFW